MKNKEQIIPTGYEDAMSQNYIDYAMSVLIARALPDVRDGLKPVQRRVLYDMYELKVQSDKPHRKSARIVGDTMGKYHPHGDSSIYETLVHMAQNFKRGQVLIDGHGNFGSMEGDGAAAMRYTEARLMPIAQEVYLADLEKNIVEFGPNFDETEKEPIVLPVRIPNMLVNGTDGIAVGLVTATPPHNLAEVIDAEKALIQNPDLSVEQLMEYVPGPDFPTGAHVINKDELLNIYETGEGKIKLRAKAEIEKIKGGKEQIVITEIPYTMIGAGIGKFADDIKKLRDSGISDITDYRNESSKNGIRLVVELAKGTDSQNLLNLLYTKTRIADTFGMYMTAVVNGEPKTLSLKQVLNHHIDFLFELCTKKYQKLLADARDKQEIQEGLIRAHNVIRTIVEVFLGAKTDKQVKECLMTGNTNGITFETPKHQKIAASFDFTERQADSIIDMRLRRLIGMEINKLQSEYEQNMKNIETYTDILDNYDSMSAVILKDLSEIKTKYAEPRKTVIENAEEAVYKAAPVQEIDLTILIDKFGYVRAVPRGVYEKNKEAADNENKTIIHCTNLDTICMFTNLGNEHTIKVLEIPCGKFRDKGVPLDNISKYRSQEETLVGIYALSDLLNTQNKIIFTTKSGMLKAVPGEEFDVTRKVSNATKLADGDEVLSVYLVQNEEYIVLQTNGDYFLRFLVSEIPSKKKMAIGVRGMKLEQNDYVTGVYFLNSNSDITVRVKNKEVHINRLRIGSRDSKGVRNR